MQFAKARRAVPDPEIADIIKESRATAGFIENGSQPLRLTDQDIIEFVFFPVVNEVSEYLREFVNVMSIGVSSY